MSVFGDRLKEARSRAGLTQGKVAAQVHVHRTTYGKYEQGLVEPSLKTLYELCTLLAVDPMDLIRPE